MKRRRTWCGDGPDVAGQMTTMDAHLLTLWLAVEAVSHGYRKADRSAFHGRTVRARVEYANTRGCR